MRFIAVAFLIILVSLNLVVFDLSFYKNQSNCGDNCGNIIKYFMFIED